ncbi:hypothetical protein [Fictibacillus terranigra]|uniref:Uncharacterized protein n=1 Tax=Fictibacillus terranigra TaxID=3058424 RepID=A0ABT8EC64_9BACL|nr:hypothetical protein [Fictibacillus sp. CENA-BCM004]MDN4075490.1 hypothetical protein [Fictibacillus sp. CENA-BCM004]
MLNINIARKQLNTKLKSGATFTEDDVNMALTISQNTGHTDDKVLFAKIKYAYESHQLKNQAAFRDKKSN